MSNILWSEFLQAGFRAKAKFPELIKFIMWKTDVKQKEIAALLGVGGPYVSDLINRKKTPDGPLVIAALSTALIFGARDEVERVLGEGGRTFAPGIPNRLSELSPAAPSSPQKPRKRNEREPK